MSSSSGMERLLNALWQHEIERINDHLPKATRSLEELLGTEKPELPTRGGGRHYFEREDLEFLGKEIPRELHSRVMLPIILTRRLDLGKGVFSVSGGRIEKSIVRWLLETGGRERFQLYEDEDGPHFVYRPQVGILISGRRTLFAVGFV